MPQDALHTESRWRFWMLIFVGWTVVGLFFSVQSLVSYAVRGNEVRVLNTLIFRLSHWYAWGLLTPLILVWARRYPVGRERLLPTLAWHGLAALAVAIAQGVLAVGLRAMGLYLTGALPTEQIMTFATLPLSQLLISSFDGVVTYSAIVGLYYAVTYYQQFRERAVRASQLEAQVAQAQLLALKMQLQPHFLFNALNSISALVTDNPLAAERMIARLSDLLRTTLDNVGTQEVPLRQELAFLETYLEIERARFPNRLSIELHIAEDVYDALVPNLLLQPLVENAIRHGIAPRPEGGIVQIYAERTNGHLLLRVGDNGAGAPSLTPKDWGVGLTNTRARLDQLYGSAHTFTLHTDGCFEVHIRLPYHTHPEASTAQGGGAS